MKKIIWLLLALVSPGFAQQIRTGQVSAPIRTVDGITYPTIQSAINSFAGGPCGIVFVPQGTYITNLTINATTVCNPVVQPALIIRGAGIGNTVIKPATNTCAITVDSTAATAPSIILEELSISNTGTGFSGSTNQGLCFTGNNTNDGHYIHKVLIGGGFYNNIIISGRLIWTTFEDVVLTQSQNANFVVANNASLGLVSLMTLSRVLIYGTVAGPCFTANTSAATNTGFSIRDSTMQSCATYGADIANLDVLDMDNNDFEGNGNSNIFLAGFMRGFNINANHLENSATGESVEFGNGYAWGDISKNFMSSTNYSVQTDSSLSQGSISIGCNFDASLGHNIAVDAGGNYHAFNTCTGGQTITGITSTGTLTPSATGIGSFSFANASAATITNFTGGDPGQILTVYNNGSSTVTFNHSASNGLYMPGGVPVTIGGGQMCQFMNQPTNGRWVAFSCTSLAVDAAPTAGNAACIKTAGPPVVIGYCSTVVGSTGGCTCN